ncbi:uncharacterized protein LOC130919124 isoform X2 [Corythoichthys intestinalis]|uniref:uncharacterized protein LOC130919124 isoform X2 n=1 Tax=Corythoichthys intestinalis TaxID=161448 RepID=UPI0025A652C2|nr:uncharacterized protein LOC130919124 isoform X2 [Corythoichthys intestinalis]
MSKKIPQCSSDILDHNKPSNHSQVEFSTNLAVECRNKAKSTQRNGDTSSSPENGSPSGTTKPFGKKRRSKKCSSESGSHVDLKINDKVKNIEKSDKNTSPPPDREAGMIALQSECANVWFQRSIYEQAESLYQCWLAKSSKVTAQLNGSAPTPENKTSSIKVFKKKGTRQVDNHIKESMQLTIPNTLDKSSQSLSLITPTTPDEGYQSQVPTPITPSPHQRAATTTARQSVNGLSPILAELFSDIWLEKPLYDRAEATFYQNIYGNNSSKQSSSPRSGDVAQSVTAVEEEIAVEEKQAVPQVKAEVFHALHPIKEEEEPTETPAKLERHDLGVGYFLHPDSEPVWLDKWRYDAAESRLHGYRGDEAGVTKKGWRPNTDTSSIVFTVPPRANNMSTVNFLAQERIWFEKTRYDEAERRFFERVNSTSQSTRAVANAGANAILQDIARARENIQKSLAGSTCNSSAGDQELILRIKALELENKSLNRVVEDLRASLSKLECRVRVLEKSPAAEAPAPTPSVPYTNGTTIQQNSRPAEQEVDEDDDVDLFGSDDDEEAEKLKEQRLKDYAERKAKKPTVIAKSSILLDVKPWDDETDMAKLEECVRSVQADGLLWGMSKLVPVGYGIKKLQISCVVEDDKVGTDLLEEEITKFEDYVQSVDVAAFNKI